jgi:hypothetical protein
VKIPVAIKILNETTGPKANVEFMDVSICKHKIMFFPLSLRFEKIFLFGYDIILYLEFLRPVYIIA